MKILITGGAGYIGSHTCKLLKNNNIEYNNEKKLGLITYFALKLITNNYYFSRLGNFLYRKYKKYFYKEIILYDDCFYPQDHFVDWNKAYGKNGLFQFQFLVPEKKLENIIDTLSVFFKKERLFSSFIVIKKIKAI